MWSRGEHRRKDDKENAGLNTWPAWAMSPPWFATMPRAKGFVTGKHGASNTSWSGSTRIPGKVGSRGYQIRSWGTGLALEELPDIKIRTWIRALARWTCR